MTFDELMEKEKATPDPRDAQIEALVEALSKLCGAAQDCLINDRQEREEAIESMQEDIERALEALAAYRAFKEKK